MEEKKKVELGKLIKKSKNLSGRIALAFNAGLIDKAEKLIEQMEELINNFQGVLPKETEIHYSYALRYKSNLLAYRGDFTQSYNTANKILTIAEKSANNKAKFEAYYSFARLYTLNGDLEKALMYFDQAIRVSNEQSDEYDIYRDIHLMVALTMATVAAIEKNDVEKAKGYFKSLEEIYNRKSENGRSILGLYKYAKAYLLKPSKRARDRIYAEELCKEIFEDTMIPDWVLFATHHFLCELLLIELHLSNDVSVIDELNPVIEKYMEWAQQRRFDYYLVEGYVLQAKLALLTFDMKNARRLLIQAQRIAERRGFRGGAEEIARLHEELKGKLERWEHMEKTNAPLSERIELAGLDDHIKGQFRTKIMKMERVAENIDEKEVTVYKDSQSCVVCKGSARGFNIYVCPTCKTIYCRTCAKAVIEIENACWTCEDPIDTSKPVKPYKQDQEEVKVDEKKPKTPKKS